MSDLREFLQHIQQGIAPTRGADYTPSGLDIANANNRPEENRGIWNILSNLARMRGQSKIASGLAARDAQDRDLKRADVGSQIESRSSNQDYIRAMIEQMSKGADRADMGVKRGEALQNIGLAEQGNNVIGSEEDPYSKRKVTPGLPVEGDVDARKVAPIQAPIPTGLRPKVGPQAAIRVPGMGGDTMVTPRNRQDIDDQSIRQETREQSAKDMATTKEFSPGSYFERPNGESGMVPNRPTGGNGAGGTDWQIKFTMVKQLHPEWDDEQVMREIANLGDNAADPLVHEMRAFSLQRMQDQEQQDESYADMAANSLNDLDPETGLPKMTVQQIIGGMNQRVKSRALTKANDLFASKNGGENFDFFGSLLQGEAGTKGMQNSLKARFQKVNGDMNLERMKKDYEDVNQAILHFRTSHPVLGKVGDATAPFFGTGLGQTMSLALMRSQDPDTYKAIGASDMDLLARHLQLTTGSVANFRTGRDILEQHVQARDVAGEILAEAQKLLAGGILSPDQRLKFVQQGVEAAKGFNGAYETLKRPMNMKGQP